MALASAPACATLILGAPPRESRAQGDAVYEPIAQFLTRVTGQKVVYHYVDNWLSYQSDLLNGKYDIVFDGPAFISWRIAKFGWSPLAKLPGKLKFVVIVQKNNSAQNINDIVGYTLCGFAPPNLATLVIQFQFKNPSRQPALQAVRTFSQAYHRVVTGRCQAGIMQLKLFQHMNAQTHAVRVIFTSKPLPNQAFSAGPRVPPGLLNPCFHRRAPLLRTSCWLNSRQAGLCPRLRRNTPASHRYSGMSGVSVCRPPQASKSRYGVPVLAEVKLGQHRCMIRRSLLCAWFTVDAA